MGWIKRNLFFVIGLAVALLLLGAVVYYGYDGWSGNSDKAAKLDEIYQNLQRLAQKKPSPGNESIDNTQIAKDQQAQLNAWIASTKGYFQTVPAVPAGAAVTPMAFSDALRQTLDQLRHEADAAGVGLPPQYDFSFTAQSSLVKFAPGSLDALAEQLGEVKALSEILYSARINDLVGIQRVRVSADDAAGTQSDYIDEAPITNAQAILTPYVITFRSFTPELAQVITAFATSSNAYFVKAINVSPATAAENSTQPNNGAVAPPPGMLPPGMLPPGMVPPGQYYHGALPGGMPPAAGMPPAMSSRGGLQTVLKEQLLQITLEVKLVKLLPKS